MVKRRFARGCLYDRNVNRLGPKQPREDTGDVPDPEAVAGPSTARFRGITKEEEEEYGKLKQWFTHNQDEWEDLRSKWKATSHIRHLELSKQQNPSCASIIELYPTLKNHLGYQLIQADFEHQFPEKATCLFDRWDSFCCGITKVFQLEISDQEGKALLKTLEDSNISADTKNVTILLQSFKNLPYFDVTSNK